ncbi:MAG: hypothetical protein ACAI43_06635 [Phycisphaerae bacterium]|nr:hypothetical protein [Tepidisphaeraceae bacterium]
MARNQSQGGSRGKRSPTDKPAGRQRSTTEKKLAAGPDTAPVGSDPDAAKSFGGKNDFGARVDHTVERNYVSANTKASDPGHAQPYAGDGDGGRTAGAGGNATGVGASSGGDIDTDVVGIGGAGLAQSAPDPQRPPGPEDSDGSSREFASGPPARGEKGPKYGKIEGTTHQSEGDIESEASGRGASAVNAAPRGDPDRIDDSFVGEISEGEAAGDDNPNGSRD